MELSKEEEKVIRALKRIEKNWPKTLWLFATGNGIHIMRCGENGEHVMTESSSPDRGGYVDIEYEVSYLTGIDNDGGDF